MHTPRSRHSTASILTAAVATLLAAALLATPVSAARPTPRGPACGALISAVPGAATASHVTVVRAKGLSCRAARNVVRRCIAGSLHRSWQATSPGGPVTLSRGKRQVDHVTTSGPKPRCLRTAQLADEPEKLQATRGTGEFGPWEGPAAYPDRWPAPFRVAYDWGTPVASYSARIPLGSVSTAWLTSNLHNADGSIRSTWFEYGITRDLGTATDRQPVKQGGESPISATVQLPHLRAGTRYWWRAVANVDQPSGDPRVFQGALGSFVTNQYPRLSNPSRPCLDWPKVHGSGQLFELTESLAISCDLPTPKQFARGACAPTCYGAYHGRIGCNMEFPRNLNAGSLRLTVPYIGYPIIIDDLASYWRSNGDNRFDMLPGSNKNSGGGEVGPSPGWHDWDVRQWAYPFTDTRTDADFWINCTQKWGTVVDADALAAGQGDDTASLTPPGVPGNLRSTPAADGGLDVSWDAPSVASPSGIAGYYLTVMAWRRDEPHTIDPAVIPSVTATAARGRITARQLAFMRQYAGPGQELYVMVAAVSREGSNSQPAAQLLPR